MVQPDARSQSGLAIPFLVGISPERQTRSLSIQAEVKAYLNALAQVMPYYEMADDLPSGVELPELPSVPDVMAWLERFEEWGMVQPGTWLDQPKWFMEDMRAARAGRDEYLGERARALAREQQSNQYDMSSPFANQNVSALLDMAELMTRG